MSSMLSGAAIVILLAVFVVAIIIFMNELDDGGIPILSGIIITVYVIFALIQLFK